MLTTLKLLTTLQSTPSKTDFSRLKTLLTNLSSTSLLMGTISWRTQMRLVTKKNIGTTKRRAIRVSLTRWIFQSRKSLEKTLLKEMIAPKRNLFAINSTSKSVPPKLLTSHWEKKVSRLILLNAQLSPLKPLSGRSLMPIWRLSKKFKELNSKNNRKIRKIRKLSNSNSKFT